MPREAGLLDKCAPEILRCAQGQALSAAKDLWWTYGESPDYIY